MKLIWDHHWNNYQLRITQTVDGYWSEIASPVRGIGLRSRTPFNTPDEARRRCFGMIRQELEIIASQAASKMLMTSLPGLCSLDNREISGER